MASENGQDTIADRVIDGLERVEDVVDDVETRVRMFTPYVVRTIEIVLAVVLLAMLARWFHLFYFA